MKILFMFFKLKYLFYTNVISICGLVVRTLNFESNKSSNVGGTLFSICEEKIYKI